MFCMTKPISSNLQPHSEYRQIYRNIYIEKRSEYFLSKVREYLEVVTSCEVGERLVQRLRDGKHPVYIHSTAERTSAYALSAEDSGIRGKGSPSVIEFNDRMEKVFGESLEPIDFTPDTKLFHELVHAYHYQRGKRSSQDVNCDSKVWTHPEEIHAIWGFPSKNPNRSRPKITENAYRAQMKYALRFSHKTAGIASRRLKVSAIANRVCGVARRFFSFNPHSPPSVVNFQKQISLEDLFAARYPPLSPREPEIDASYDIYA